MCNGVEVVYEGKKAATAQKVTLCNMMQIISNFVVSQWKTKQTSTQPYTVSQIQIT